MNSFNDLMAQSAVPEDWHSLLQVAVREVFEIMLGAKLEPPTPENPRNKLEFTAMVGLAGQLCGVLTLRCGAASAALMTSKMLGVDPQQAKEHVWDGLGEICNMIAGNFKNKLSGISDRCMLSVPTVITGADYSFHSLADRGGTEVALQFEGEPIFIALELHS